MVLNKLVHHCWEQNYFCCLLDNLMLGNLCIMAAESVDIFFQRIMVKNIYMHIHVCQLIQIPKIGGERA